MAGVGSALGAAWPSWALSPTPRPTPGPFYPRRTPIDHDNDLILLGEDGEPARGTITHLHGRILAESGEPIPNARVEIWQCDFNGHYHHTGREHPGLDAAFQGFGRAGSDAQGHYAFRTIRPVPYAGRTPHIHFRVEARGYRTLTTQLYVRGEALNQRDFLFQNLSADEQARTQADFVATTSPDAQLEAKFDLVLAG